MSRWPAGIIVFFFVIAGVNSMLLYLAMSSRTELIESSPYEKGIQYQGVIDEENSAREFGLSDSIQFGPVGTTGNRQIAVSLKGGAGVPLKGAQVSLEALRPNDKSMDIKGDLVEDPTVPGTYRATLRMPVNGLWLISLAINGEGRTMHIRNRQQILQ